LPSLAFVPERMSLTSRLSSSTGLFRPQKLIFVASHLSTEGDFEHQTVIQRFTPLAPRFVGL
jgi:hypothetical protein